MTSRPADQPTIFMSARAAAVSALICCLIWAFCSVLPTGLTTCLGLPFAVAGFSLAFWTLNKNWRAPQGEVGWLVTGALAIGGLGCAWQVVVLTFAGTLLGGLLVTVVQALQATSTP